MVRFKDNRAFWVHNGGVTDMLSEMRLPLIPFISSEKAFNDIYLNRRAEAYFLLKTVLGQKCLKIIREPSLQAQLLSIRYKYMSQGGKKAIVSKDDMKKEGLKSPDKADALVMAVWVKDAVLNEMDTREDNLPAEYAMTETF